MSRGYFTNEIHSSPLRSFVRSHGTAFNQYNGKDMKLPYRLGHSEYNELQTIDLSELPHLIIGGGDDSERINALRCLVTSIAFNPKVKDVSFLIINFSYDHSLPFNGLSKMACPVITEVIDACNALFALEREFHRRLKVRTNNQPAFPPIVCIIDNIRVLSACIYKAKLKRDIKELIEDMLRGGHHMNIHMVIAADTFKKSENKFNVDSTPARIAFYCQDGHESRSIIGRAGAEKLTQQNSMLYLPPHSSTPMYIQGLYIPADWLENILNYVPEKDNKSSFIITEKEISKEI